MFLYEVFVWILGNVRPVPTELTMRFKEFQRNLKILPMSPTTVKRAIDQKQCRVVFVYDLSGVFLTNTCVLRFWGTPFPF